MRPYWGAGVPCRWGGDPFREYGGATTCVFLRLAGQPVVLDAGTGLMGLPALLLEGERRVPLLLSHPHADHLLGLPLCPTLLKSDNRLEIYAVPRDGLDAQGQVRALMSPPLWPVGPGQLPARMSFHELRGGLALGPVAVEVMEGVHPGGVTLMKLTGGGKRVVFATDCTLTEQLLPRAAAFAAGCDLLLCDGQYSEEEWPLHSAFGHSTWTAAARFGRDCGAKQVRVIHHDPTHTDALLHAAAPQLAAIHSRCAFAREGETIEL